MTFQEDVTFDAIETTGCPNMFISCKHNVL